MVEDQKKGEAITNGYTAVPPPYEIAAANSDDEKPLSGETKRKSFVLQQVRPPPGQRWGARHTQALLLFLCTSMAYCLRVILSVAIVAMVDKTKSDFPVFDWEKKTQSIMLSAFFWGYIVMQVPSSQLAQRFGAKLFLGGAMCGTGLATLILPVAATYGDWPAVVVARVASGLCQGFIFPCCYTLMGKWTPPLERGRTTAFVMGAQLLGPVVGLPLTGMLATSSGGWPSVFYVFGAVGIAVGILVWIFTASAPSLHKRISDAERSYIEKSIGTTSKTLKAPKTPWASILKSMPFWGAVLSHCGQAWGMLTFLTEIPTYMSKVLLFDIKSNGVLSAIPYLTTWLMTFVFSWISDKTTEYKLMSLTTARKTYNTIGTLGPGLTMLALGFFRVSPTYGVVLLTLALGLKAGTYVGFKVNYVDLAPQFSGTLFGVGNVFAVSIAALAPISVGLIVTDPYQHDQWQYVFYLAAAMFFLGCAVFLLFGSAEVQPWNGSRKASLYLSKDSIACQELERLRNIDV